MKINKTKQLFVNKLHKTNIFVNEMILIMIFYSNFAITKH